MVTPEATMNPNVQIMVRLTTINGSTSPTSVRKKTKKKDLSEKDIEAWETYIKNPSDVYDKEKSNQK